MVDFISEYERVNNTTVKCTLKRNSYEKSVESIPILVLEVSCSMVLASRFIKSVACAEYLMSKIGCMHLLTFNDKCWDKGLIFDEQKIEYGRSGMAYFQSAYEKIVEIINEKKDVCHVIFLTHGLETKISKDHQEFQKNRFKENLKGKNCIINVIGIESSSNSDDMKYLTTCGSINGIYHEFLSVENELEPLIKLIGCTHELDFRGEKHYIGFRPICFYFRDTEIECGEGDIMMEADFMRYTARKMLDNRAIDKNDVLEFLNYCKQILYTSNKAPRSHKKILNKVILDIYNCLSKFYGLLTKGINTPTRVQLLKQEYFIATNKDDNMIQKEDVELYQIIRRISKSDYLKIKTNIVCSLTCSTVVDLLKDGDCIGVGFNASRDEYGLLEISYVRSYYGCRVFLEAFDVYSLFDDLKITKVFPLYINELHWRVAKLYVRRMVNHLEEEKITTIFFMYVCLHLFCRTQRGNFFTRLTGLIRETLLHIYEENKSVIPTPDNFCNFIKNRQPEKVPYIHLLEESYSALSLNCDNKNLSEYIENEILRRKYHTS